jgi:hypothetical protein
MGAALDLSVGVIGGFKLAQLEPMDKSIRIAGLNFNRLASQDAGRMDNASLYAATATW